jgi:predicted DNA-binding transcriptional regulator AlpA
MTEKTITEKTPTRILSGAEVDRRMNRTRTWRWRHGKAGTFISPVQLPGGRIGYREDELETWIAALPKGRTYQGAGESMGAPLVAKSDDE